MTIQMPRQTEQPHGRDVPTSSRYVYAFDEGDKDMKDLLGGKGANLAEMTRLGLPVPPGFTISTDAFFRGTLFGLVGALFGSVDAFAHGAELLA